jgi:hypothetical protein
MNASDHKRIVENGLKYLPEPSVDYWMAYEDFLKDASNFPDIFWPGANSDPTYLKKYPRWKEYIHIPVGDKCVGIHPLHQPTEHWKTAPPILAYLIAKALEYMRNGTAAEAAIFAGVLSHVIGDTGQAAHVADHVQLSALFQEEEDSYLIHSFMEANPEVYYPEHTYQARCLGNSEEELRWRLLHELAKLKKRSMRTIVPIMSALLKEDPKTAARYAAGSVGKCADLFADVLNSLYQVYQNKSCGLETVSLLDLEPIAWHCDGMFNFLPQKNHIPGRKWNEPLPLDIGHGAQQGIALLPEMYPGFTGHRYAFIEYTLPKRVFQHFSCLCGLNRLADRNDTSGIFEIQLDGETAWQSSVMEANAESVEVKIELGNAEFIRLYVRDSREDAAATKFFYPCFIEPIFYRIGT